MAMIYTELFADKIDERFTSEAVSQKIVNNDYSFVGAKTVKVTSINTVDNRDYDRSTGYGNADILQNSVQEMTLTKDRSFKMLLDKMDEDETKIKAGEVLARQLRERVIPEIEKYRFETIFKSCDTTSQTVTGLTASNAYAKFLEAQEKLNDEDVPQNRIAYVTPEFLTKLKKDDNFIKASDIGQNIAINGLVGMVDGVPIVRVTKKWMEAKTGTPSTTKKYACLVGHNSATVAPVKLAEYRVVTDSENYSGTLFLGRFYYDCFVLNNKAKGLVAIEA
nr:MAG TPA: major capsid protein [Caudoviricetes sp.]